MKKKKKKLKGREIEQNYKGGKRVFAANGGCLHVRMEVY